MPVVRRLSIVLVWVAASFAATQTRAQQPVGVESVLAVPYLPQSVLLCGGAALAMAERWWGRRGVYAEDFAHLVKPAAGGILTTDLATAARDRGWDTRLLEPTSEAIGASVAAGVPVIALIEVGRDRYHYVVVLHWGEDLVVYHDPARAPQTRMARDEFLARWSDADRWAMTIRPGAEAPVAPAAEPAQDATPALPCSPWLTRALEAAAASRLDLAADLLATARTSCPGEPRVLRELAGVWFRQGLYADAAALSERYLAQATADTLGWQILGASRFLAGDRGGALQAWNRAGQPTVDLIQVDGTHAIRYGVIAVASSTPPGTVLSPRHLTLAQRRVADLPAVRSARVDYEPLTGGIAEVHIAVAERPVLAPPRRLLARAAIGAVGRREIGLEVATPLGLGEQWTATWRWTAARPRVAFRAEIPVNLGMPGIMEFESAWERFRFASDTAAARLVENDRRSATVQFGGWITARLRPSAAVRLERWSGDRSWIAGTVGAEWRTMDDRLVVGAGGEHAVARSAPASYSRASAFVSWSTSVTLELPTVSIRAGADWVSRDTPLGNWPIAGGNVPWAITLRAHPLNNASLAGRSVGRRLVHGGISGDYPVYQAGPVVAAVGAFVDAVDVAQPADGRPGGRLYVDAGGGLRFGLIGQPGVLRIDLARGLAAEPRTAVTVGIQREWRLFRPGR